MKKVKISLQEVFAYSMLLIGLAVVAYTTFYVLSDLCRLYIASM